MPLTTEQLEDWVLANLPEFTESMTEADDDLRSGLTSSLEDVFDDED